MFGSGIKLYKRDGACNDYVLELWGASTKHPDSTYLMKNFEMAPWVNPNDQEVVDGQVYQWLLECASKCMIPMHAEALAEYAWNNWRTWRK